MNKIPDTPCRFRLGSVVCATHSIADLLGEIRVMLARRGDQPRIINVMNAHVYNLCQRDGELLRLMNQSRIATGDGMSIVWAARFLGVPMQERCNMTEAFRAFLADPDFPDMTAVLVGGNEEVCRRSAEAIERDCARLKIIHRIDGYQSLDGYRGLLAGLREPDFVLVGMGSPKSEQVCDIAARIFPRAIIWHIGGGTLNFYAGTLTEAPLWMRRAGLQWLHRLALEPGRMWRRYLLGNPEFIGHVLAARVRHGKGRELVVDSGS